MNAIVKMSIAVVALVSGLSAQGQQLSEPPTAQEQAAARALAERRQKMIDECEQNFGSEVDCTREVDTELRAEGLQSGGRVIRLRPGR